MRHTEKQSTENVADLEGNVTTYFLIISPVGTKQRLESSFSKSESSILYLISTKQLLEIFHLFLGHLY